MQLVELRYNMKLRCTKEFGRSERGVSYILALLFFMAIAFVLGLAIDGAQIYRAQLRLQRAVDAGAIGGSEFIGNNAGGNADAPLRFAEEFTLDNLSRMGMGRYFQPRDIRAEWDDPVPGLRRAIRITGTLHMPTLLIHLIHGLPRMNEVTATARAATIRRVIVLVLDLSSSMTYLDSGNPRRPRMIGLVNALRDFIPNFRVGFDVLGMVAFHAKGLVPTYTLSNGTVINSQATKNFKHFHDNGGTVGHSIIDRFGTVGGGGTTYNCTSCADGTNTDGGLRTARRMLAAIANGDSGDSDFPAMARILDAQEFSDANKAIVLITDGDPTRSCTDAFNTMTCNNFDNVGWASLARHFDRALIQADQARRENPDLQVFSIGLGNSPRLRDVAGLLRPSFLNDPYDGYNPTDVEGRINRPNDALDPVTRLPLVDGSGNPVFFSYIKESFLRRVANVQLPNRLPNDIFTFEDNYLADYIPNTRPSVYFGQRVSCPRIYPDSIYNYVRTGPDPVPAAQERAGCEQLLLPTAPQRGEYYEAVDGANLATAMDKIGDSLKTRLIQ